AGVGRDQFDDGRVNDSIRVSVTLCVHRYGDVHQIAEVMVEMKDAADTGASSLLLSDLARLVTRDPDIFQVFAEE
ncbi:MAG TPA: hypothetical protein VG944_17660, partial [Fimbriimonas sp.]|nr:hypothetical protein [Fimbriimonas sp.]